jgi:hypothetical protein
MVKKEIEKMTEPEAREKAEYKVNVHMNKSLVEYEAKRREIKVGRSLDKMKLALIEAYVSEWTL